MKQTVNYVNGEVSTFKVFPIALYVWDEYYDLGRLVVDIIEDEGKNHYDFHLFFDKKTMEKSLVDAKEYLDFRREMYEEDGCEFPDYKAASIAICMLDKDGVALPCEIGSFELSEGNIDSKIKVNEEQYNIQTKRIAMLFDTFGVEKIDIRTDWCQKYYDLYFKSLELQKFDRELLAEHWKKLKEKPIA